MSVVSNMKIERLLDQVDLLLNKNDIIHFCDNIDVINNFIENYNPKTLKQFLIDNEKHIDKEKLLLLIIVKYKDNLKLINKRIDILNTMSASSASKDEITYYKMKVHTYNKKLENAMKLGKGMNSIINYYYFDDKDNEFKIEVMDSREIIDGKKSNNSENLNKFNEIDLFFKQGNEDEEVGIEYVIQALLLTDLSEIFPYQQFGNDVRTMLLENEILRKGIKTKDEINELREKATIEEYSEVIDSTEFNELLPQLKEVLKKYIQYVDIDKLLLISAYRFYEGLENGSIKNENCQSAKEILTVILQYIKNENLEIECELQTKKDNTYDIIPVKFSTEDIKESIDRLKNNKYITKKEIEDYKEKVNNQEINLSQIDPEYIDVIFSQNELEKLSILNEVNLIYVISKLDWKREQILDALTNTTNYTSDFIKILLENQKLLIEDVIELYMDGIISIEQIKEVVQKEDLIENINSYELNQYYLNSIDKDSKQEDKNKYEKYLQLYKDIIINEANKEQLEESANKIIEHISDEYDEKDKTSYINSIINYYKEGLLTLDELVEWNGKEIIDILYNEKLISLYEIEQLVKSNKLKCDYIIDKYVFIINNPETDYEERLKCIKTGYISEDLVFDLYKRNLIFDKDLIELSDKGIISREKTIKIMSKINKEELEKHSSIKLVGLNKLSKKNNQIYLENDSEREIKINNDKKRVIIIDPNERMEYINLFKAYRANTDLEEGHPFYNYEFYVIPDESEDIGLNSVVIAERYYEDKETEEKFATNNATYFFKYKDLMVLSNMKKSEMTKERENIVFTANHTLSTEKRNGHWAASVIYSIVKTMLSSDLKEYSKENQRKIVIEQLNRIYNNDEILAILEKGNKIDSGEYNGEIINPDNTSLRKKSKNKKNLTDDNEQR